MKFKIPKTPSSTNKSIRFPNDLIEQVEDAIRGQDCNFFRLRGGGGAGGVGKFAG